MTGLRKLGWPERVTIAALAAFVAALLSYGVSMAGHGLDLTDESSYLNWIANPFLYRVSLTQYGFVYHPLFLLVDGSIAGLRLVNAAITIGLGSVFGYTLLRLEDGNGEMTPRTFALAACLPIGLSAMLHVANWITTPNYNSLNLQGLLIAATALILLIRRPPGALWPFGLLGFAGSIALLAKPSSAALLAVVAFTFLLATRRASPTGLFVASIAAAATVVVAAFAIDGSLQAFVARITNAASLAITLDQGYGIANLVRFDAFEPLAIEVAIIVATAVSIGLPMALGSTGWAIGRLLIPLLALVALAVLGSALAGVSWPVGPWWWLRYLLQIIAVPTGAAVGLVALVLMRRIRAPSFRSVAIVGLLLVMPYVYACGTSGNYWSFASGAGVFWVGAAVALVQAFLPDWRRLTILAPLLLGSIAITAALLGIGMHYPYRQPQPLRDNDSLVAVFGNDGLLVLPTSFANYADGLQQIARNAGFQPGDGLIDLTGHYPGASVLLGAQPIGQAWMIGGYPGSAAFATQMVLQAPCLEIVKAWLLVERDGPRALPGSVIGNYDLRYEPVGIVSTPFGEYSESFEQELLKPVHDAAHATKLCETKRLAGDS